MLASSKRSGSGVGEGNEETSRNLRTPHGPPSYIRAGTSYSGSYLHGRRPSHDDDGARGACAPAIQDKRRSSRDFTHSLLYCTLLAAGATIMHACIDIGIVQIFLGQWVY